MTWMHNSTDVEPLQLARRVVHDMDAQLDNGGSAALDNGGSAAEDAGGVQSQRWRRISGPCAAFAPRPAAVAGPPPEAPAGAGRRGRRAGAPWRARPRLGCGHTAATR